VVGLNDAAEAYHQRLGKIVARLNDPLEAVLMAANSLFIKALLEYNCEKEIK
jgi:hypothetical protein